MKRSRTSEMWKYFTVVDKGFAMCDLCRKKLSYKSSTSNLKKHLQGSHVHVNLSSSSTLDRDLRQTNTAEELLMEVTSPVTCSMEDEQPVPSTSRQQVVQSAITEFALKRIGINEKKKIDGHLLKLFTKDFQPFSVVEDIGFRSFVRALNPSYEIPSRKHVANVLLPAAYTAAKVKVEDKLLNVKTVCLTTDCWTSAANESYMAVTGHYIAEDFTLQSVLLGCGHFSGSHTAHNLSDFLLEITNKFKLTGKILLVVTDNATNIKSAVVSILQWKHFGCYAHSLNLVVQDALKNFTEVHHKVKNIVGYFKRSSLATEKLVRYQKNSGVTKVKKLMQDMPTRWNSTLFMLERLVELQDAVKSSIALSDVDMETLTAEDWVVCKELCTVLKPFQQVSTQLSGESYPTGSQVIVLTRGLMAVCNELLRRPFNKLTLTIVQALINGLTKRFQNVEMSRSIGIATLLDPRFKILAFENNAAAENAKQQLVSLVAQKLGATRMTNTGQRDDSVVPASTTSDNLSIWGVFDNIVRQTQPQGTPQSRAIVEVQRYLDSQVISRSEDPLTWWRENQYIFPTLAKVVKERFNIVATSVPCERIFSKAGIIINERRTSLKPTKVEQLIFLNKNDSES